MSDMPSLVPTPGTGTGSASDVPSIIPTLATEPSPPSPPSSTASGGGGSGSGTSGANAARLYYSSALAACVVVGAGIAGAM
jgi:hypothetical protein